MKCYKVNTVSIYRWENQEKLDNLPLVMQPVNDIL